MWPPRRLALLVTALAVNCATGHALRPGTGDVAFRLVWAGPADLDLMVWEPGGFEIDYHHPASPSGGRLDVDCNATPENICTSPIENVFWARGTAPVGTYYYDVRLTNQHHAALPVVFTVFTLHGARIVRTEPGQIQRIGATWGKHEASYP